MTAPTGTAPALRADGDDRRTIARFRFFPGSAWRGTSPIRRPLDAPGADRQSGVVLGRLILLFITVPLAELALLLWIGSRVGVVPTVLLIIVTGVLGASLARHQGFATWGRFQAAVDQGRIPGRELAEGLIILIAGAVLLTPGVLTDATGFLILVPAIRRRLVDRIERAVRERLVVVPAGRPGAGGTGHHGLPRGSEEVIEADFEVVDRDDEG